MRVAVSVCSDLLFDSGFWNFQRDLLGGRGAVQSNPALDFVE